MARSAISELVVACGALPDLDTFQLVRIPIVLSPVMCLCGQWGCRSHMPSSEQWEQASEKRMKDLVEWTRPFEAADNRMSGEEEEGHVESHQVLSGPSLRGG